MRQIVLARVKEIRRLHEEIGEALRTTLPKAIRIGELLSEQKAECKHGEWLPWLKANCPFSERTAQDYLRFYTRRAELKSAPGADIRGARSLLADLSHGPGEKVTARPAKVRDVRAALIARPTDDDRLLAEIAPRISTMSLAHRLRIAARVVLGR